MSYHRPVLLAEAIAALEINPDGIYVDVTYGGGGHSKEILKQLSAKGKLVAFDQDADAANNVVQDERLLFVNQNFKHLKKYLKALGTFPVNGILADLGVSSYQFDTPERGFSFRFDAELDMRMSKDLEHSAKEVLMNYAESELLKIFSEYGEVRNSKTLAARIVEARKTQKFESINDFLQAIDSVVIGIKNKYLAQVFQALRIEVNEEMQVLEALLQQALESLQPEGNLVVLSYHSLEDRMVKNFMKTGNIKGEIEKDLYGNYDKPFSIITKKPIEASEAEVKENPRARSAKMRVASKN
jgi:16S rRNA (cytosine1402-N4)-methyltransferase